MIKYVDMTQAEGCFGIIAETGETIVFTGVSVNSMPMSVKRKEGELYEEFARKYGINFIFDNEIPNIDFYTIPRVDVVAVDNKGGFIASVGEPFSLSEPVPLIYISKEKKCYLITDDSRTLLSIAGEWRARLIPYSGITIYDSKDCARKDFKIIDLEKTDEYRNLMKLINNKQGQA